VVQNQEPKHFLAAFNGKLMVHRGRETAEKRGNESEISNKARANKRAQKQSSSKSVAVHRAMSEQLKLTVLRVP